jgi:hypothetical protein
MTNYPGTLDSFTNPSPTDYEDAVSHSGQHSNINDAMEAVQGVLGTTGGTSLFSSYGTADKPVKANSSGTLTQSLGLGTLTSGTVSITSIKDDDTMADDSATALASQQSIKAYVGAQTSTASSATPTPTGDRKRNELYVTALAAAAEFQAPSGTPSNGNILVIRVKDDGTARALTYNAIYSGILETLPSTTTISKVLYMGFIYNSTTSKWELVAKTEQG